MIQKKLLLIKYLLLHNNYNKNKKKRILKIAMSKKEQEVKTK